MIEKILSSYQQLLPWSERSAPSRRRVCLQATPLEERATPAIGADLLPVVLSPEVVWIAPLDVTAPMPAAAVAAPTEANVRTDLFGSGDCDVPDEPEIWQEWFAARDASQTVPARQQAEPSEQPADQVPDENLDAVQMIFTCEPAGESAAAE